MRGSQESEPLRRRQSKTDEIVAIRILNVILQVCLSLLGTWQGPGWIPGKSSLLQVIISIQSMILCDEVRGHD